jgi:hypothetical protein
MTIHASTGSSSDLAATRIAETPGQAAAPDRGATPAPTVIKGRFVLEHVLGAGGMGTVYKARDLLGVEAHDRNPYVALKVLGEQFRNHPDAFITLQREAKKTRALSHPNIVTVYDFDRDGGTVFLTMEYLEGQSLDGLLRGMAGKAPDPQLAWHIIRDVGEGLKRAHGQDIIHSDLKPANVFVLHDGHSKILDFGIARAASKHAGAEETAFDAGSLGAMTPAYASFDMLIGDSEPHYRDDIYAFACIVYELLAGQHPYQRRDALRAKATDMKPAPIPSLSRSQWQMLERALSFQRTDCPSNIEEFLQGIVSETAKTRRKSRWITLTVLSTLLLGVAASAWFWFSAQQAQQAAQQQHQLLKAQQAALQQERQAAVWRAQLAHAETCLAKHDDVCAETNANAVLASTDQPRARAILREISERRAAHATTLSMRLAELEACVAQGDQPCQKTLP